MPNAYVVDACRTPRGIGKVGKGALAHLHPSYLGSTVLKALAERNQLNTSEIDDVIWNLFPKRKTIGRSGPYGGAERRL